MKKSMKLSKQVIRSNKTHLSLRKKAKIKIVKRRTPQETSNYKKQKEIKKRDEPHRATAPRLQY